MVCVCFSSSPIASRKKTLEITIIQQINVSTLVLTIDSIWSIRVKVGVWRSCAWRSCFI
jgi:hypothetical protein